MLFNQRVARNARVSPAFLLGVGLGAAGSAVSPPPPPPSAPTSPTGLTAVPNGVAGQLILSSSRSTGSGSITYAYYKGSTPGGESGTALVTGLTDPYYLDTAATIGSSFYYTSKATNNVGSSAASNEASFVVVLTDGYAGADGTTINNHVPDHGTYSGYVQPYLVINSNHLTPATGSAQSAAQFAIASAPYSIEFDCAVPTGAFFYPEVDFGDYFVTPTNAAIVLYESGVQVATAAVSAGLHTYLIIVQSGTISVTVDGALPPAILYNVAAGKSVIGTGALQLWGSGSNTGVGNYYFDSLVFGTFVSNMLATVTVGSPSTVATHAQIAAAGLVPGVGDTWFDGTLGVLAAAGGNDSFFGAHGSNTSGMSNIGAVVGTLAAPVTGATATLINVSGQKAAYDYCAGGPIYNAGSGNLLMMLHCEFWGASDASFWSELHLAWSANSGATWTDLGPVIQTIYPKPATPTDISDAGIGSYLVIGGYFYRYFLEHDATNANIWPAVARAPVADVLAAAALGNVTVWQKWHSGSFSTLGLGGLSSALPGAPPALWGDTAYHSGQNLFLMAGVQPTGSVPAGGVSGQILLSKSLDGIAWSPSLLIANENAGSGTGDVYPTFCNASSSGNHIVTDPVTLLYVAVPGSTCTVKSRSLTFAAP